MSETIVIQPDPVDHSAHEAAMIAKAEGAAVEPVITEEAPIAESRPEGLPEKFATTTDLAKAYAELEKKLGASKEEAPAETPAAETPAEITPETPQADAAKVLEAKGLDFNKYHEAMVTNGELSEADYTELAAAGIPKEMVDGYVSGQAAIAEKMITSVKAEVGGDSNYESMIAWAETNLTQPELIAFDNAVTTTDVNQAKLAVSGLYAKYTAANGSEPELLETTITPDATDVYLSNAQVTADMKTPLYKKDSAEQARVQAKLGRSKVFS